MNFTPISKETHQNLNWRRPVNFDFASEQISCPISFNELGNAALALPLAFTKVGDGFEIIAILGCQERRNIYVTSNGQWAGTYIPNMIRAFPFRIMKVAAESNISGPDKGVLCFDDSGTFLCPYGDGERFFEDDALSAPVLDIANTLEKQIHMFSATNRLCQLLEKYSLLEAWEPTIQLADSTIALDGIYKINHTKLNSLSGDALAELTTKNAMAAIYCQTISMKHILAFPSIIEAHDQVAVDLDDALGDISLTDDLEFGALNLDNI